MQVKEIIKNEIENIPENYLAEVLDFVYFIEIKHSRGENEIAIASESSLKKDWLKPEEEKAWKDL